MSKEQEKLEAAKTAAKEKAGEKKEVSVDTITFKKNSGSAAVYSVLEKSKKALTLEEIVERADKDGYKNAKRAEYVAKWFAGNGIATKTEDGKYLLVPKTTPETEGADAKAEKKPAKAKKKPAKTEKTTAKAEDADDKVAQAA